VTLTCGVGVTVRVTDTVIGGPFAGVIVMVPLYVPVGREGTTALLSVTMIVVGTVPVLGPTVSQLPPDVVVAPALNEVAVPVSERFWATGTVPTTVEKVRDCGLAPMLLTVNDT